MKILLTTLFSILLSMMAFQDMPAQVLPDVYVENSDGKQVSIRSVAEGKPAIIAYWSIACKPCIQELNAIADNLEDWSQELDFRVIAVSVDDVRMNARAKAMAMASGWDFVCVYDENQDLKRAMNVSLTPHSFIIDSEGKIVYSHSGYTVGSEHDLFDRLIDLVAE